MLLPTRCRTAASAALALAALAGPAAAHTGLGGGSGFASGFLHPLLGADHVVAMVAVGLWGAFLGRPALWLLPVIFPLVMAAGGAAGVARPAAAGGRDRDRRLGHRPRRHGRARRPPAALGRGTAGRRLRGVPRPRPRHRTARAANPAAFAMGFVIATGLLHLIGIALGTLVRWPAGSAVVRAGGGLVSAAGVAFLFGLA